MKAPTFRSMREADRARQDVQSFRCGDAEWEIKVARFLTSGEAWAEHASGLTRTLLYCDNDGAGRMIGFANVAKTSKGYPTWRGKRKISCLLLAWLAIGIDDQGAGHGKTMIQRLAEAAILDDPEGLYLLVDERNNRAISFYRRLGFVSYLDADLWVDPDDDSRNLRMILPLV